MASSRGALVTVILAAIVCGGPGSAAAGQRAPQPQPQQQPQQLPGSQIPPIGGRSNFPLDDEPSAKRNPQEQLKESQKKLSSDVEQLLQLAKELKNESDKTKETEVLSLPLIHKAEEIEKLAKQIKDLARAN